MPTDRVVGVRLRGACSFPVTAGVVNMYSTSRSGVH